MDAYDLKKRHRTAVFYKSFEEEKYAYSQYDKIVFVSEAIRVAFGEMFGIELVQNAAVCYNPLEAKTIRRMAEAYEVAHDKFTICAVGRVIPEKGFLRLTSICEHMVEDGRDFTLNIVASCIIKTWMLKIENTSEYNKTTDWQVSKNLIEQRGIYNEV